LLSSPADFREEAINTLSTFWKGVFEATWKKITPELQESLRTKSRLYASLDLKDFAREALLRIEVDPKRKFIQAVRGGFRLRFDQIDRITFVPSAFNDRRYWTTISGSSGQNFVYFPFFEPGIDLADYSEESRTDVIQPALDVALIFKALGDPTRFALVSIVAKEPQNAARIAKQLSLTRATVSHHVSVLREAGLITETFSGGSVILSLKKEVLESISGLTIHRLFSSNRKSAPASEKVRSFLFKLKVAR